MTNLTTSTHQNNVNVYPISHEEIRDIDARTENILRSLQSFTETLYKSEKDFAKLKANLINEGKKQLICATVCLVSSLATGIYFSMKGKL